MLGLLLLPALPFGLLLPPGLGLLLLLALPFGLLLLLVLPFGLLLLAGRGGLLLLAFEFGLLLGRLLLPELRPGRRGGLDPGRRLDPGGRRGTLGADHLGADQQERRAQ